LARRQTKLKIKNFGSTLSNYLIGEVTRSPNLGVGGRFSFQAVFGVDRGLSSVHPDTGLSIQVLFGGGGGFVFLSANGNAQGALLLSLEGGKDFIFFHVALFPHCIPMVFPLSSYWVLNMFSKFTMCSATCSPYKPAYIGERRTILPKHMGRTYVHQNRTFYFEEPP
jgi:hypothetical protein